MRDDYERFYTFTPDEIREYTTKNFGVGFERGVPFRHMVAEAVRQNDAREERLKAADQGPAKAPRKPPSMMSKQDCVAELIAVHGMDSEIIPDYWDRTTLRNKVKEMRG